ncbi:MAG: tetratricopeptide repeat protein [Cyanobacteriota bacterium]
MLAALVLFSALPLATSIWQNSAGAAPTAPTQLENQAKGYQLVLEREPSNQTALLGLLETRLQQGDLKSALIPLERLAQLAPEQTRYALLLAETKAHLQDYSGAVALYRTLLEKDPASLAALKGLGKLYLAEDRPKEAVALIQNAITGAIQRQTQTPSPEGAAAVTSLQLLLGEIYLDQNRITEALAVYETAQQVNPEDFRPVLAQAMVFEQQGKLEQATPLFQTAQQMAPPQYQETIRQLRLQPSNN